MKYLFDHILHIQNLQEGQIIALFLDYDGTLTPIAPTPDQAVLSPDTKKVLQKIIKCPKVHTAIVSGRSLEDVRRLIGIKDLIYIGNHGFEIKGSGMEFEGLISPAYRQVLAGIKSEIIRSLESFQGVIIENKGITLSVHYRLTQEDERAEILRHLEKITKQFISNQDIHVTTGKMVFEIRPPIDWDKGKAVMWVFKRQQLAYEHQNVLPIYIGDDVTDEDAFFVLKDMGVTVCVGQKEASQAQYYVNDPDEVIKFLEFLLKVRQHD